MNKTPPRLSVIIASAVPLREVPAGLSALIASCQDGQVELILVSSQDTSQDTDTFTPTSTPTSLTHQCRSHSLAMTFVFLPPGAILPRLLGVALARARGEIVAILDASCRVDDGWVTAILAAHASPQPVIGGVVEPEGLQTLTDWAAYLCEYGQFLLPLSEGIVSEVPGNNLSMKRWVLAKGRVFVEAEFWKTYWCRWLQAEGIQLYSVPSIRVSYRKTFSLRFFLIRRFHHGRCFAGMRLSQLTRTQRLVYLMAAPLLPVLLCIRIIRAIVPKRRYRSQFVCAFPIIVLATVSWAVGEWLGYLAGKGGSCQYVC